MPHPGRGTRAVLALVLAACGGARAERPVVRISGSAVGAEGVVLALQVRRFAALHPELEVAIVPTPDAADQRHQLLAQWLSAGATTPDVLQIDVIWTPELAAAGWLLPLDDRGIDATAFFPQVLAADRWRGRLYAVPLFVDVGMLYWRTDLVARAPATYTELAAAARAGGARFGLALEAARYEGLVTGFLEVLAGFGGAILDDEGRVVVDSAAGQRALAFLRDTLPRETLGWQEEEARFAFQNGDAVFMRNWPYAYPLMQDPARSRVAGRFAVAPMPAEPGGQPAAALGGAQLAVNARSRHPDAAWLLAAYLTAPAQLIERARLAGQYPARPALYTSGALDGVLPIPAADARRVIEHAIPRPVTPVYAELSAALQIQLHRALTGQAEPAAALGAAAAEMRAILAGAEGGRAHGGERIAILVLVLAGLFGAAWVVRGVRREPGGGEERLGWLLAAPAAAVVAVVALFPLAWTVWESLHEHDLRLPGHGRPFVAAANYLALAGDARFWAALAHTAVFAVVSVAVEVAAGLAIALLLHGVRRGRGALRALVLLPWAIPTVVAALVWRFMFADAGVVNAALAGAGVVDRGPAWLLDATLAWVPIVLGDAWRTTPFVALLLLAGLAGLDPSLYDAARTDGAGAWQQFRHVTLPLLKPALLVALVFRTLDAFRVFDLIFVLTGGAPGTATEPIALLDYTVLRELRLGRGAALSVVIFAVAFALALLYVRLLGMKEEA